VRSFLELFSEGSLATHLVQCPASSPKRFARWPVSSAPVFYGYSAAAGGVSMGLPSVAAR
jgi:hypothetical protein